MLPASRLLSTLVLLLTFGAVAPPLAAQEKPSRARLYAPMVAGLEREMAKLPSQPLAAMAFASLRRGVRDLAPALAQESGADPEIAALVFRIDEVAERLNEVEFATYGKLTVNTTAAPDGATGTVRGTVRNAESGAPVTFTRLRFYDPAWHEAESTVVTDGSFTSPELPAGRYFVFVERSGNLAPQFFDGLPCIRRSFDRFTCDRNQARAVEVVAGGDTEIAITMRPGATFRGSVREHPTLAALPESTSACIRPTCTSSSFSTRLARPANS